MADDGTLCLGDGSRREMCVGERIEPRRKIRVKDYGRKPAYDGLDSSRLVSAASRMGHWDTYWRETLNLISNNGRGTARHAG